MTVETPPTARERINKNLAGLGSSSPRPTINKYDANPKAASLEKLFESSRCLPIVEIADHPSLFISVSQ
jgi:hypothetical protein